MEPNPSIMGESHTEILVPIYICSLVISGKDKTFKCLTPYCLVINNIDNTHKHCTQSSLVTIVVNNTMLY